MLHSTTVYLHTAFLMIPKVVVSKLKFTKIF